MGLPPFQKEFLIISNYFCCPEGKNNLIVFIVYIWLTSIVSYKLTFTLVDQVALYKCSKPQKHQLLISIYLRVLTGDRPPDLQAAKETKPAIIFETSLPWL